VSIKNLLSHPQIWRGRDGHSACATLPTGFDALDQYLPGGGWPQEAITEIFLERYGIGELSLLMPSLAFLSRQEHDASAKRWIVWIDPPFIPYAPALTRCGVDLDRVLLVHSEARLAPEKAGALWAVEQTLRSRTSVAALAWLPIVDDTALRRLQLSAEEQACWTVLFRPIEALQQRSPAGLRLKLSQVGTHTRVEIIKCRGKRPGIVALER